jgi:chromate reductase
MTAQPIKILGICGSLREKSYNLAALRAVGKLLPANVSLEIYEGIGSLPFFNQDDEKKPNEQVARFKDAVRKADLVLFSTPEYNYSVPGVLKNAIDIGSRPYDENIWAGKPVAIISASIGLAGGVRAQLVLKNSFGWIVPSPHIAISTANDKFDASGNLTDEATVKSLRSYLENAVSYARHVQKSQ